MTLKSSPALYNQTFLSDDDFVDSFVARQSVFKALCRRLIATGPEDDGNHQILVGTRGMGKTSLLRRLAIEMERDPQLSGRFIPLSFREEQYNVLRLRDFWQNCGEALAEWAEAHAKDDLAARLDAAIASDVWADDAEAAEAFLAEVDALGKRPVLLVDNLDLIIDALQEDDCWRLRNVLQRRGGPIIIGAATHPLQAGADRDAAFYEFFKPVYLDPLSLAETRECMRALAEKRAEHGKHVIRVLQSDPARLEVLHRLTGGNPRVLAITYRFLETAESKDAMGDLERLLDEVTPYYKARIEEYHTPLQRATIDAIALHWDPVTTGQLSEITGVPTTTLSPQLNRLRKDGLIETTETSGAYAGHQIVERFLNIWYLMRHGTRRTKQRMRWLVAFLSSFYSSRDLAEIDREARAKGLFSSWSTDYANAFKEAMKRAALEHEAMANRVMGSLPDLYGDEVADLIKQAKRMLAVGHAISSSGDTARAIKMFDDFVLQFDGSDIPELIELVDLALVGKCFSLGKMEEYDLYIENFDMLMERFYTRSSLLGRPFLANAMLLKGAFLRIKNDLAGTIDTYNQLVDRFGSDMLPEVQRLVAAALLSKGISFDQIGDRNSEIAAYDELLARYEGSDSPQLQEVLAEALIRKSIALSRNNESDLAIHVADSMISRFCNVNHRSIEIAVARMFLIRGVARSSNGNVEGAIGDIDESIERFSHFDGKEIVSLIVRILNMKALIFAREGKLTECSSVCNDIIEQYYLYDDPIIQEKVAEACFMKSFILYHSRNLADAALLIEKGLGLKHGLQPDRSDLLDAKTRLANCLIDLDRDLARAEALLLEAAEHQPLPAYANLFWLYALTDRADEALEVFGKLDGLPPAGRALMEAALALSAENFGEATGHLEKALRGDLAAESFDFTDDIERLIRIAVGKGFGERLIAWFEENRFDERFAPVYAAMKAVVFGEKVLLDVNPEVRHAASLIYARMAGGKKPKKAGRKKRKT